MKPQFKTIKTRKEHLCNFCEQPILKGEEAQVMSTRMPRFQGEFQVGIKYERIYLHLDSVMCWDINNK
jgi:hypothetical protein